MKIVQVVRYVEANNRIAGGTVVLTDEGSLYIAKWDVADGIAWERMVPPPLPVDVPLEAALTVTAEHLESVALAEVMRQSMKPLSGPGRRR